MFSLLLLNAQYVLVMYFHKINTFNYNILDNRRNHLLLLLFFSGFFVLLAMAVYTGVTVNYYGKRYGNWRFSWSYIIGWVSVVLTFFSGTECFIVYVYLR